MKATAGALVPSAAIRHAEVDGARVILDLATESYRVLDDVASAMWRVLIGAGDRNRELAVLTESFEVERERLEEDLGAFADRCVREGLLTHAPAGIASPAIERAAPSTPRAGVRAGIACLLGARRDLARHGFRTTYERYASLPRGREASRLRPALRSFHRAENLFVAGRAPNDCLVRSLALYRYLCGADVPAQHVIGVRRFPLQAHAWTESAGEPLLDVRARGFGFEPLARLG